MNYIATYAVLSYTYLFRMKGTCCYFICPTVHSFSVRFIGHLRQHLGQLSFLFELLDRTDGTCSQPSALERIALGD